MQWTCKRCGLQRDDRRGSGCNDVKGQAHDWIETRVLEEEEARKVRRAEAEKEKKAWKLWIKSSESFEWKNEFIRIKIYLLESVEIIQKQYIQTLEESKTNYKRNLIEIENRKKEYNNKINKLNNIKEENSLLYNKIVPLGKGIFIRLGIGCLGFYAIVFILNKIFLAITIPLSIVLIPIILFIINNIIYKKKIKSNSVYLNTLYIELDNEYKELNNFWNSTKVKYRNDLKEIKEKYETEIKRMIQKAELMIKKNNNKHNVNKGFIFDNEFNYEKKYFSDLREKYINDEEFVRKFVIDEIENEFLD